MILSIKKIWPILFVISFILHREITSIEVNFVVLSMFTIFFLLINNGKIIKRDFELIFTLILILILGLFSAIFNKPTAYNLIRDVIYFIKPIMLILLGYFVARRINDWKVVFKALIYLGVGYAVYHILHTLIFTDFRNVTISRIRGINGLSNIIEIFAIALIILGNKFPEYNIISKKRTKKLFLFLLSLSFVLYFSRTMFVGLVFLILGVLNYLKLNKKGIKYLVLLTIFVAGLYSYLYSTDIKRDEGAIENFFYKIKIAPSEIFSPSFDYNNHADLWDHWRAYEAFCAIQDLNKFPVYYIGGKGLGAMVDLKFAAPISSEGNVRFIPILHNGYVFILFKTGIIGLLLYLFFLFSLYFQAYRKSENLEIKTFRNLLSATSLYLLFSSLIITGLYNLQEETAMILGIFLYLKSKSNIENNENRNYRN